MEEVELIGGKGNAALVTFREESSCARCVERYADSSEMRATFVGKKRGEGSKGAGLRSDRDFEDLEDWKIRRGMEREEMMSGMTGKEEKGEEEESDDLSYPPPIPVEHDDVGLTPFERLLKLEKVVLEMCK